MNESSSTLTSLLSLISLIPNSGFTPADSLHASYTRNKKRILAVQ